MIKYRPENMYIRRILKPRPSWLLRFRHGGKVIHCQTFSDTKYKTSDKGLEAALKIRAEVADRVGVDLSVHWRDCKTKKYRYTQKKRSYKNNTGVIGVSLYVTGDYRAYRAAISFDVGRETAKTFNCKKLGTKIAFTMAVLQRKHWENDILKLKYEESCDTA